MDDGPKVHGQHKATSSWVPPRAAARYAHPRGVRSPGLPPSPQRTPPSRPIRGLMDIKPQTRPNEYVDIEKTPKLPINNKTQQSSRNSRGHERYGRWTNNNDLQLDASSPSVIRIQPQTSRSPKDIDLEKDRGAEDNHADLSESVICRKCGRCKCDSCTNGKRLPERWICNKKFLCSPDRFVNVASCLCAVEGCLYHCCKDHEQEADVHASDEPCACCSRPYCFKRWSLLAAMSVCLPCLLCYWPLRGCVSAVTGCYNCNRQGCRCRKDTKRPANQQQFLLESESSSA